MDEELPLTFRSSKMARRSTVIHCDHLCMFKTFAGADATPVSMLLPSRSFLRRYSLTEWLDSAVILHGTMSISWRCCCCFKSLSRSHVYLVHSNATNEQTNRWADAGTDVCIELCRTKERPRATSPCGRTATQLRRQTQQNHRQQQDVVLNS